MQSFRTELEDLNNPVVEKDIIDLEKKIRLFQDGKIDEEKFRSLRLARGVYGQRQPGVQMVRIKLPFGRISTKQLRRIADLSDEYASRNLHLTTRQDIQIHYVSLDRTPELWAKLEKDDITLREACGNTVRNITASATAGVDPQEPFDVSPYAYEMFRYFLRNPICQDMGRKFKIAFSSSDDDTAYAFIHDIGFIPRVVTTPSGEKRGFKVVVGGGLGANPYLAQTAFEFLDEDKIIPYTECLLRIFDRYGERNRRMKARFKFLLDQIGLEQLAQLVEEEKKSLQYQSYDINRDIVPLPQLALQHDFEQVSSNDAKYQAWRETNVFSQKQQDFFGVYIKLPLGNLSSDYSRLLADIVDKHAGDDIRITVNQGLLLRYVREEALVSLFNALDALDLAEPGFDSVGDVTACPGTDTCNLGISSSYGIAKALEHVVKNEYPELIRNNDIKIKISGCPNSCGQHGLASIGFHGSSIKDKTGKVLPALVVLLGGARVGNGDGIISDKIIKIPSKRGPQALRVLLDDYDANAIEGEYYHDYFKRTDRKHFYDILKPLGDVTTVVPDDYIDWDEDRNYILHTAVGECAGVIIDLVSTLLYDSAEKLGWAEEALKEKMYADSIYHSYTTFVNTAKALLLSQDVRPSTQHQTISDFHEKFVVAGLFDAITDFKAVVYQINKHEPTAAFAEKYLEEARRFLQSVYNYRDQEKISA